MLPANAPVLAALALPTVMVVSNAAETGFDAWSLKLSAQVLGERLLVQIREKGLEPQRVQFLLSRALTRGTPFGATVVVNSDCGAWPQADGVHLTAKALMEASARPAGRVVGASCHDAHEIAHAARLGLDYVVVGPVKDTPSHPGAATLGWEGFAALVRGCPLPAYAIGGLTRADLAEAKRRGAHGVALRTAAFAA